MCSLAIHVCFGVRDVYLDPLPIFKLEYLSFYLLSYKNSLYILDTSSLPGTWFAHTFPFHELPFQVLNNVLWRTKSFNFVQVQLSIFSFVACPFGVIFRNPLPNLGSWRFTPAIVWLFVSSPKFICWNPYAKCDGIWGLLRSWGWSPYQWD